MRQKGVEAQEETVHTYSHIFYLNINELLKKYPRRPVFRYVHLSWKKFYKEI